MTNPYYNQHHVIRREVGNMLPKGLETTFDVMLECMSKSDDEQQKNAATFIKASKIMPEMEMLFSFAMSLIQHDITPIRESIYDTGIDGIRELNDQMTDKYEKNENVKANAKSINFLNWLILRLPAKGELKRVGLVY